MNSSPSRRVAVIGGGPAGLMAAEVIAAGGMRVDLFDAMPSVGRKFLLAGKGGLNLTHSEPLESFLDRFGARRAALEPMLCAFGPAELRHWAGELGVATFVGSSGRVFPVDLKAAPLLRAWLHRLRAAGVSFHMRQRWIGWHDGHDALRFSGPNGETAVTADAVVLALGGGSWARLGSDGAWLPWLAERGVEVTPLRPSNCGFEIARRGADGALSPGWSAFFRERFAGQPLKNVALALQAADGRVIAQRGEFVVTGYGIEGSLVYALSGPLRDTLAATGAAGVQIDLLPGRGAGFVHAEVARPRGSRSLATHLKSRLGLDGVKTALLHELLPRDAFADPARLAAAIKALPLALVSARPIDEAISSAGGVRFEALDDTLMLRALPGVFCAGEMLDWEAPTGGYLLSACFASGAAAGRGVLKRLGA
ncbi:MAG: TIGR03862 family flavoprotein [Burkholderiaceae bacterium]